MAGDRYNLCSNPECLYSKRLGKDAKYNNGCPMCGADVLYTCPHCKDEVFEMKNQRFCTGCRKEIKPAPQKKKKCKEKAE